jgi:hypothetical protein
MNGGIDPFPPGLVPPHPPQWIADLVRLPWLGLGDPDFARKDPCTPPVTPKNPKTRLVM